MMRAIRCEVRDLTEALEEYLRRALRMAFRMVFQASIPERIKHNRDTGEKSIKIAPGRYAERYQK